MVASTFLKKKQFSHSFLFVTSYFKLVFLPVDNDRSDLLVHEEEDCEKQGWDGGKEVNIPRRVCIK